MYKLNDKIKNLTPYIPLKDEYDIRLDANESFVKLPNYILDKVDDELSKLKLNRYPDPAAIELCTSFGKYYGFDKENIVAGNGSDELIFVIMSGFLMKNDTFAVFEKDFSMYEFYGSLSECNKLVISKNDDFTVDYKMATQQCLDNKVDLLIFSNPCNPTSQGMTCDEVCYMAEKLEDTLVIVDEAYMEFWNQSVLDKVLDYPNVLVLKTCSKAFGMAGLRVGFAVGNESLITAIKSIKSPYNLNAMSQAYAKTVLEHKKECESAICSIINSKNTLFDMLKELENDDIKVLDSKTNFIVVKTNLATGIYKYLLENGIAIRCFGDFLRITAGTEEENLTTVNCIKKYLGTV